MKEEIVGRKINMNKKEKKTFLMDSKEKNIKFRENK
jgi:hypothetical protein